MNLSAAITCFAFILSAFLVSGVAQTLWFRSKRSHAWMQPLDLGFRFRGHRLLGDNKTLRGFVVFVPVTAAMFALAALAWGDRGPWELSVPTHAWLGGFAAFGFMLGELPNSFLKRRLAIRPGQPATGRWRGVFLLADRVDSILGMLIALSLFVPVPALTWVAFLVIGPAVHFGFSALMFRVGVKARAA